MRKPQFLKLITLSLLLTISLVLPGLKPQFAEADPPTGPWDTVKQMTKGINIGNTMEADYEGDKQPPVQEYYFADYKEKGFTYVRIPVKWDKHTATTAPYTIDSAWLDRVEQVVDWSLAQGLITIINTHHEDWLMSDYSNNVDRLDAMWTQIADRFKDKSPNLIFEIFNEPHINMTLAEVNDMNQRELDIIRNTNPTRNVIITPWKYASYISLQDIDVPDDPHIIGTFHYYLPNTSGLTSWGTDTDKQTMASNFREVRDWSVEHNLPIVMGEYGLLQNTVDSVSRLKWYAFSTQEAIADGFSPAIWENGSSGPTGIYHRSTSTWDDAADVVIAPKPLPDLLDNSGFENGTTSWTAKGGSSIAAVGSPLHSGTHSLKNSGRTANWNGPEQDVTSVLENKGQGTYSLRAWLRLGSGTDNASVVLKITDAAGTHFQVSPTVSLNSSNWTGMNYDATASWTGTLQSATVYAQTQTSTANLLIDDFEMYNRNLLTNAGFESGTSSWTAKGTATIASVTSPVHSDGKALEVSGRTNSWNGPQQDVTNVLRNGGDGKYELSSWIKLVSGTDTAKVTLAVVDSGGTSHFYHTSTPQSVNSTSWSQTSYIADVADTATMQSASLYVETTSSTQSMYIDDCRLTKQSY